MSIKTKNNFLLFIFVVCSMIFFAAPASAALNIEQSYSPGKDLFASYPSSGPIFMTNIMYVYGQNIFVVADQFINASRDGGATWKDDGIHGMFTSIFGSGKNICLGTFGKVMYCSSDTGVTWSTIKLPNQNSFILDGSIDTQGQLISIVDSFSPSAGIYVSLDAGNTWKHYLDGVFAYSVVISNKNIYSIFSTDKSPGDSGLHISNDYGKTWKNIDPVGVNDDGFSLSASGNNIYYLANSGTALYVSKDGGATWQFSRNFSGVQDIASENQVVAIATTDGVYTSHDGGVTWDHSTTTYGLDSNNIFDVSVDSKKIYAGSDV